MDILDKISRTMLCEAKTKISPLLNSIYKKQDNISKDQAESLVKALDKVTDKETSFTVSHGLPIGSGTAQIVIKRSDEQYDTPINSVNTVLKGNGHTVISSNKSDGKTWTVKFK